jgi:exopolysaccharide biosynthesis polyprenyl glycosylphosphotransferase
MHGPARKGGEFAGRPSPSNRGAKKRQDAAASIHRVSIASRLLFVTGRFGPAAIALASFFGVLTFLGDVSLWMYEAAGVILVIRALYALGKNTDPAIGRRSVRHSFRQAFMEEVAFSVIFLAACFVRNWPIEPAVAVGVIFVNFVLQSLLQFLLQGGPVLLRRIRKAAAQPAGVQRVIVVGTGSQARRIVDTLLDTPHVGTTPVGFLDYRRTGLWRYRDIPLLGRPDLLEALGVTEQIDALFLALEPEDVALSNELFATAERMGIPVCLLPEPYRKKFARSRLAHLNGYPVLAYHTAPTGALPLTIKNLVDKILALIALIVSSPVLLLTAIAIKVDSRGPVLFRQVRMGLNGRRFHLYKLRTMCLDAEKRKASLLHQNEMSGPVFKIKEDPRVTRVGRFLRKYSLDEFPQLVNVLKGDMSLVGPRPPLPHELAKFKPWQRRKLSVKPGVTCLWQINGRNAIDFEHWMRLDLEYIDNWSLALDARILVKTIPAVLKGSGS